MPVIPIDTVSLFPVLDTKLIELLRGLSAEEWTLPTVARKWRVKDVAVHLLHGNVRILSGVRDRHKGVDVPIDSWDDLVNFLNTDNNGWVDAWRFASPAVLVDLLEHTGAQYSAFMSTMDPFGPAPYSVAWAGETASLNWFNTAREYTEKWHHQQQIRDAVGKPGIMTAELYHPCLDTFMRALPHTYRSVNAVDGTVVKITIIGDGGGDWWLVKRDQWQLTDGGEPAAHTVIDGAVAWKLFTKSWRREEVKDHVTITGDQRLGAIVLEMISVMA